MAIFIQVKKVPCKAVLIGRKQSQRFRKYKPQPQPARPL